MKQSLILTAQVVQQLLQIGNVHLDGRGKNIRVVACLGRFLLFIDLHRFHGGQLGLDELQCSDLVKGCNVQIDTEKVLQFEKIGKYGIRQLTRQNVHSVDRTERSTDLKVCLIEFHAGRSDKVLGIPACFQHLMPVKNKRFTLKRVQAVVESFQSFLSAECLCFHIEALEHLDDLCLDIQKFWLCLFVGSCFNGECQELSAGLSVFAR